MVTSRSSLLYIVLYMYYDKGRLARTCAIYYCFGYDAQCIISYQRSISLVEMINVQRTAERVLVLATLKGPFKTAKTPRATNRCNYAIFPSFSHPPPLFHLLFRSSERVAETYFLLFFRFILALHFTRLTPNYSTLLFAVRSELQGKELQAIGWVGLQTERMQIRACCNFVPPIATAAIRAAVAAAISASMGVAVSKGKSTRETMRPINLARIVLSVLTGFRPRPDISKKH